ncbi:hypothetical protein DENSPDRAFT_245519 [Dentipellis sp. KUC8613]|nr:hypothetical protein DENSPDRAFT_245519 [Dentipellis sp. KUC8613]
MARRHQARSWASLPRTLVTSCQRVQILTPIISDAQFNMPGYAPSYGPPPGPPPGAGGYVRLLFGADLNTVCSIEWLHDRYPPAGPPPGPPPIHRHNRPGYPSHPPPSEYQYGAPPPGPPPGPPPRPS